MDTSSESPSTLSEIPRVLSPRSEPPEPTREPNRRWFSNEDYDLFVWFDVAGSSPAPPTNLLTGLETSVLL